VKPPGLALGFDGNGLTMRVTQSDRASDAVWNAVQEALDAQWTPEKFIREVYGAWEHERKERTKSELEAIGKHL
jgi:hypothetical protein